MATAKNYTTGEVFDLASPDLAQDENPRERKVRQVKLVKPRNDPAAEKLVRVICMDDRGPWVPMPHEDDDGNITIKPRALLKKEIAEVEEWLASHLEKHELVARI